MHCRKAAETFRNLPADTLTANRADAKGRLSVGLGDTLQLVLFLKASKREISHRLAFSALAGVAYLDGVRVGRALGGVDELVGEALRQAPVSRGDTVNTRRSVALARAYLTLRNADSRAPVVKRAIDWLTRRSGETSTACRRTVPWDPIRVESSRGPVFTIASTRIWMGFWSVKRWMISNAWATILTASCFLPTSIAFRDRRPSVLKRYAPLFAAFRIRLLVKRSTIGICDFLNCLEA